MRKKILLLTALAALFTANSLLFSAWGEYDYDDEDYVQDFYDGFGTLLGRNVQIVYEYQAVTADGAGDELGYSLRKSYQNFFSVSRNGVVSISETLGRSLIMEYTFQEVKRETDWGGQILRNNLLDGIYMTLKRPGKFGIEFMNTFPVNFNVVSEDELEMTRIQSKRNDYTGLESANALAQRQGFRFFTGEELFKRVSAGGRKFFDIKSFEIQGLTLNKSVATSRDRFYKGGYDPNNVSAYAESSSDDEILEFYLQVVPLNFNSDNSNAYAAVYGVVNNTNYTYSVVSGSASDTKFDDKGNSYIEVEPGEFLRYKIRSTKTNLKSLTAYVIVANSYAIQVSPTEDGFASYDSEEALTGVPFNTVAYSTLSDGSHDNFTTEKVRFGVPTANNFVGLKTELTLFTFDLAMNLYKNYMFYQFPNEDGEYFRTVANSIDITLSKSFGPLSAEAQYYKTDPGYETRTALYTTNGYNSDMVELYNVLDNDDGDFLSPIFGDNENPGFEDYEGKRTDRNNNGEPDFNEDILMIGEDSYFFRLGQDFNNNGVSDEFEDDNKLDYDVAPNVQGYRLDLEYLSTFGLEASAYLVNEWNLTQNVSNFMFGGFLQYLYSRRAFGFVNVRYGVKRVKDGIADNISAIVGVTDGVDPLDYKNSLVHSLNGVFSFWAVENMIFEIIPAVKYNKQYDETYVLNGETNSGRSILENGITFRAKYKLELDDLLRGLSITPMGKFIYKDKRYLPTSDYYSSESEIDVAKIGFIRADYRHSETLSVSAGYQYRKEQDFMNHDNDWYSHIFLSELKMYSEKMTFLLGYRLENYNGYEEEYTESKIYMLLLDEKASRH